MRWPGLLILLPFAGLVFAGCPNGDGPKPSPTAAESPTPGESPATDGDQDPLAGSIFSKEDLFEIYAAEAAGGEKKAAAYKKHRLVDASGQPVTAREEAYERALKQFASKDREGWAKFVESLPE